MAKLGDVIKISDADYTALKNAGSAGYVINGVRYYYNENNIYLTPSNGGGGGGTATDVQINGTSITSNNVANILTNSSYSSSNKIATMSDLPHLYLHTLTGSTQTMPVIYVITRDPTSIGTAVNTGSIIINLMKKACRNYLDYTTGSTIFDTSELRDIISFKGALISGTYTITLAHYDIASSQIVQTSVGLGKTSTYSDTVTVLY